MENNENKPQEEEAASDKVDLTELQGFSFGPDWTDSSSRLSAGRDDSPRERRPRRDDRPGSRAGPPRKDRRRGAPGRRDRPPLPDAALFEPTVSVQFFPEENGFHAVCQAMRHSCRTYELFEIAHLILAKPERYLVEVKPKPAGSSGEPPLLYVSVPDELPFEREEDAINHVMQHHLGTFFDIEEVETDAPKGNFQYVSRCAFTGTLLAPPNYHRYTQILQEHHAAHIPDVPFDRFKAKLETLRDEESISAWLDNMKKGVRYTYKEQVEGETHRFESAGGARAFLLRTCRNRVVNAAHSARFPGILIKELPPGNIRRSIETVLHKQNRFPLDTANGLRGRLRRHKFHIYKKGSHGVSYVCAVRRNFRRPDQVFAESVGNLLTFLEENPMIPAAQLPEKFLGLTAPVEAEPASKHEGEAAEVTGENQPKAADKDPREKKLLLDLRWLVTEGYVAEYSDGRLYVHPAQKPEKSNKAGRESAVAGSETVPTAASTEEKEPAEDRETEPTAEQAPAEENNPTDEKSPTDETESATENSSRENPA
jgi:hypothetical protein